METLDISDRRVAVDRLTCLPDDLICRILSLLPTIDAVRTSVLSSKLRSVYTRVPSIDVDDIRFSGENKSKYFFIHVLNRLIAENTNDTIPFFRLSCYGHLYEHTDISSLILAVVRKNVENLHFSLPLPLIYRLPREIYACTSLVTLSLHGVLMIRCLVDGDFPKLKTLLLYSCVIDSTCFVSNAAPFLEKLCLHGCYFKERDIHLSLPSLKSLCVRYPDTSVSITLLYNIILKTPNLHCLTLHNSLPRIQWEASPILLTKVRQHISDFYPYQNAECGVRLAETLNDLCSLKKLTLSSVSQKLLLCSTIDLPVLQSLTHLKLRKNDYEISWGLMTRLSEFAPNLDILDLDKVDWEVDREQYVCSQNDNCFPKKRNRLRFAKNF